MKRITNFFIKVVERWMPDPFIYAVLLTLITFFLGIIFNGDTPANMVRHWGNGFWNFLAFGMQMVLVIVFGTVVARSGPVDKLLKKLAKIPKNPKQAVMFVTFVAAVANYINWGFGIIVGAVISIEVAKKVKGVDFRLLLAGAYGTAMVTMPSNTIILKVASDVAELTKVTNGVITEVMPMSTTVFSPMFMLLMVIVFISMPILNSLMHPSPEETISIDPSLFPDTDEVAATSEKSSLTPAEIMENFTPFSIIVFVAAVYIIVNHFFINGKGMDINMMNFCMMTIGIILHKTPIKFVNACADATKGASGVILQFPFYAGIMGMMLGMNAAGNNLANVIASSLVHVATPLTLPLIAFTTAAILNFFVPSSGGLWAVQAPFMFPAAQALGVNYTVVVCALVFGEIWTNIIQPFWAMPLLGIAGMKVRDIMGFCTTITIYLGLILVPFVLIWSAIAL